MICTTAWPNFIESKQVEDGLCDYCRFDKDQAIKNME
jgi:hypothetical protein